MAFTGFTPGAVLALLVAAGAALYALHRLRSRPQRIRVVTTLFWPQARSAAQPRFLWHRFRYLGTFLLLLGVVSMLMLAVSRPAWSWSALPARHTVLVVDAGLSMQAKAGPADSRFDEAIGRALKVVNGMGSRDRLAVVVADPFARVIHGFEQPLGAASIALARSAASSEPSYGRNAMQLARSLLRECTSPRIIRITDRAPSADDEDADIPVEEVVVGRTVANAAVVSAVFAPEASRPSQGRLVLRVGWWADQPTTIPILIAIDGQETEQAVELRPGTAIEVKSQVVQAAGQDVRIRLRMDDAIAADNSMIVRLPRRPEFAVSLASGCPEPIRAVLEAASIAVVPAGDDRARINIRSAAALAADQPEVVLIGDGPTLSTQRDPLRPSDAFAVSGLDFEQARAGDGGTIAPGAHEPLITAGDRILAAVEGNSPPTRLLLGSALFGPESTVVNHPAFAQFLVRALRDLAGWDRPEASLSAARVVTDGAWAADVRLAGPVTVVPGDAQASDTFEHSNLLSADGTRPATPRSDANWPWSTLLMLGALLLMVLEVCLHVRGRIV